MSRRGYGQKTDVVFENRGAGEILTSRTSASSRPESGSVRWALMDSSMPWTSNRPNGVAGFRHPSV